MASRLCGKASGFVKRKLSARGFRRDQDLLRHRLVKVLDGEASILYFLAELNEFSNLGKGLKR
jgi:hypothetical protein